MIKKSFKTLKENPVIFLGFAVPVVLMLLCMIPMMLGFDDYMSMMMDLPMEGTELSETEIIETMSTVSISWALGMLIGLVNVFVVLPPVLHKIYEACSGIKEKGWIKRGLNRSWWKIFVTILIIWVASIFVVIFSFLIMLIPILGMLVYVAAVMAIGIFAVIAITAVIAEEDFGTALGNTFKVGWKYFFKQLGTLALVHLPILVVSIIFIVIFTYNSMPWLETESPDQIMNYMSTTINMAWIMSIVMSVYGIFAYAFIFTYSMHQYLFNRELTMQNVERQGVSHQPVSVPLYNIDHPDDTPPNDIIK